MGNEALRAQVSRLEAELHAIEIENNQLRAEINSTVNSVNQANKNLTDYNRHVENSLDNATGVINQSINRALDAYELQGQIDILYKRYKQVELANKHIRELNNKKYYEFNNYRTIRKIVQGMMDNLDLSMVKDSVIYKSVERQHLLTPDFWLTSALISIMAWKADDKALADRAIEVAYQLDPKNSSVFYMIFNLRMDRNDAAIKWFLEYQKCELKGSDENTFLMMFSLISKTLSDTVDDQTSHMISDYIHNLIVECARKEGYSENDIINLICRNMQRLMHAESYDLPILAKYCKDYDRISQMLNLASNNYNILEFILRIVNVPVAEKNTYLKEYLNELLAKPNSVEIETYNEIEYNELVIKLGGDVESAKQQFEEIMKHRENDLNIISAMISWVYDLSNENVNGQMRLNMFTLLKSIQEHAVETYFKKYRDMYNVIHPICIMDYSTDANFMNEMGELSKIDSFYQNKQHEELASVKNTNAYIAFGAGVACGVAAFFVHLILLAGAGIGIVMGVGILIANNFKRKNIVLKIQSQKENVVDIFRKLVSDFSKMKSLYTSFDEVSAKITEELAKL